MAEGLAEVTKEIRELEEDHSQLRIRLSASETQLLAAKEKVAEAQMRLDEATVTNLLADFIRDRADSNDYRKHLGLLALVRQDFERLSNLMDEQNFYLVPPTPFDNQSAYDASKNFKLLKTKKKKKKNKSIESF